MSEISMPSPQAQAGHTDQFIEPSTTVEIPFSPEFGVELSKRFSENEFSIYGHGTSVDSHESFFNEGIWTFDPEYGGYNQINNFSIPVSFGPGSTPESENISNEMFMNDWPHKRNPNKPVNVVLMAIPFADPENGISRRQLDEQIIDFDKKTFPAELVFGYYDASAKKYILKEGFEPTVELRQKYLESITKKIDVERAAIAEIERASNEELLREKQLADFKAKLAKVALMGSDDSPSSQDIW